MRKKMRIGACVGGMLLAAGAASGEITVEPRGSRVFTDMLNGFTMSHPPGLASWSYADTGPAIVWGYDAVTNASVSWEAQESYSMSTSLNVENGVLRAATAAAIDRMETQTPPSHYFGDVWEGSSSIMEFRLTSRSRHNFNISSRGPIRRRLSRREQGVGTSWTDRSCRCGVKGSCCSREHTAFQWNRAALETCCSIRLTARWGPGVY